MGRVEAGYLASLLPPIVNATLQYVISYSERGSQEFRIPQFHVLSAGSKFPRHSSLMGHLSVSTR